MECVLSGFEKKLGHGRRAKSRIMGQAESSEGRSTCKPKLNLTVGDRTATLKHIPIFTTKMGSDIDELYGNLGQDMVSAFDNFTLDFSKMTFTLGTPVTTQNRH
jgi:hypothetical protein